MPRPRFIALAALTAAIATATAIVSVRRSAPTAPVVPPTLAGGAHGRTVNATASPEEIFRRAFWRQPAAGDRIVHAERHEWVDDGQVQRWQWFLEVQPDPSLLRALRDPAGFGLVAVPSSGVSEPLSPPVWFPRAAQHAGCEILQSPGGGLTVCYRAADNVLFATDSGRGFAAPVVAVSRR